VVGMVFIFLFYHLVGEEEVQLSAKVEGLDQAPLVTDFIKG
jgi:hypothetical protein